MSCWLYMVLAKNGGIYTGVANDLAKRLQQHKSGKGSRYLRSFGYDKLIYAHEFPSKGAAMSQELKVKALSREEKLFLAKACNEKVIKQYSV